MRWQTGVGMPAPRAADVVPGPTTRNAAARAAVGEPGAGARQPGYLDAFVNLTGYDIRDRLAGHRGPDAIVWGRNDQVVPVPAAFSYQRRIGDNARLEIFDETGHVPQLERPVRFNRLLERFLAE